MYDGVDLACILDVYEEVICKELLVEDASFEHFGADKSDEFLPYLSVRCGKSLGFGIAVIDRNAEFRPEKIGDVTLSASYSSCNSYRFWRVHPYRSLSSVATCSMR